MSAAASVALAADAPPAPVPGRGWPPVQWSGVAFSVTAAAPMRQRGVSAPQAVDALRAFTAPRARIDAPDVPHGPERRMLAQMAASSLIPGRAWAPSNIPSWIGYPSAGEALEAYAAGLLAECRAAGMEALAGVCRVQSAEVAGLFLDARAAPGRLALLADPASVGMTHRVGARIAAAPRMAGVLAADGTVAVYRLAAIRLRPLGHTYEIVVRADGEAVARRITAGRGFSP